MKTRHTPGGWHIGSGNGEGSIFADEGRMRLGAKGTTLYPITTVCNGWDEREDNANARLIAKSPKMFWALDTIRSWLIEPRIIQKTKEQMIELIDSIIVDSTGGK